MTGKDAMHWRHEGAVDGAAWRSAHPDGTLEALSDYAQRTWAEKANRHAEAGAAGRMRFYRYGPAYAAGIRQGTGMAMQRELLPLQGSASAVLYANGRAAPLQAVLAELERLPLQEIVVVLGADAEPVLETLLSHPRIVVVHSPAGYESPHAARAAGARLTGADTVLFADGAKLCPARLLGALLVRTDAGTDAALSDRTSHEGSFDRRGEASWLREFLNVSLGRPDLRADAIGGVPFALSRRAIDAIGTEALGIPARAQAAALVLGLRVSVCDGVPFSGERDVPVSAGSDHTAAWRDCLSMRGARLGFPDHKRNRQAIGGGGLVTDDSGYPQL
ncbi:hypothetical protein [Cohnella hashimotonis]|uniref:Glycosyltransferase n=1 Tax=Cohnella hashimotonis TaxID=2826895 RepID=A0ABT6TC25_9BACL|nr:hypothetical protein [Cohnella hashimotonis]MDI4644388.1 hypothetical protein [Cohnella hashimotonis]